MVGRRVVADALGLWGQPIIVSHPSMEFHKCETFRHLTSSLHKWQYTGAQCSDFYLYIFDNILRIKFYYDPFSVSVWLSETHPLWTSLVKPGFSEPAICQRSDAGSQVAIVFYLDPTNRTCHNYITGASIPRRFIDLKCDTGDRWRKRAVRWGIRFSSPSTKSPRCSWFVLEIDLCRLIKSVGW